MYIYVFTVIPKIDAGRPIGDHCTERCCHSYQRANDTYRARKRRCYAYYSVNCACYSISYIRCFINADNDSTKSYANAYWTANACCDYSTKTHSDAKAHAYPKVHSNTEADSDAKTYGDAKAHSDALQVFVVLLLRIEGLYGSVIGRSTG
jgi:hypothetical protein